VGVAVLDCLPSASAVSDSGRMDEASLSVQIATAARELRAEPGPGGTMGRAIKLALQLVGGAQEAAISLVHRGGRIDTPAASSEAARHVDQLQYDHKQGPCLDAIRQQETIHSLDVSVDDRWPLWGPAATEAAGVRSMLCFHLFTHRQTVGALNLYSRQVDAFDDRDRDEGLALAAQVAIAVASARELEQLHLAMDARNLIGQAQGIIMATYDLDAQGAFAVLSRLSMASNRKLRDVAAEIADLRQLPPQEPG
jgi:GAF domain-containing protein